MLSAIRALLDESPGERKSEGRNLGSILLVRCARALGCSREKGEIWPIFAPLLLAVDGVSSPG